MKVIMTVLSMALALSLVGCKRAATPGAKASAATSPAPKSNTAKRSASAAAVVRIVFVDQEKPCACTRERIDKSWKALSDVVGFPPIPDVQRIHMDSQPDKAAPYRKQRAIMVPPAIYFFDKQNKLVTMLQGEVKSEQVRATLK